NQSTSNSNRTNKAEYKTKRETIENSCATVYQAPNSETEYLITNANNYNHQCKLKDSTKHKQENLPVLYFDCNACKP
ncbi:hypothetical protein Csa_022966, partial [Cucumis sativus]